MQSVNEGCIRPRLMQELSQGNVWDSGGEIQSARNMNLICPRVLRGRLGEFVFASPPVVSSPW